MFVALPPRRFVQFVSFKKRRKKTVFVRSRSLSHSETVENDGAAERDRARTASCVFFLNFISSRVVDDFFVFLKSFFSLFIFRWLFRKAATVQQVFD
jgi:hypothetical protein